MMNPLTSLPVLAVFSLATSAQAGLLVHEQFLASDYTADTTVVGQNGGTGFTGDWSQLGGLATHVDFYPRTAGLSYTGLETAGGAIEHFRISGTPGTKRAIHAYSFTPTAVTESTHLYIGFLFEVSSGAGFSWIYSGADNNRDSVLTVDATGAVSLKGAGTNGSTLDLGTIQAGTNMVLLRATDATS